MAVDKENIKENIEMEETKTKPTEEENATHEDDAGTENAEDTGATEETPEDKKEPKKKHFGKKEPKKDKKDIALEELTDKHQRLMAEFQNFRSRTEKEKSAMYEVGAKSVIEKILSVIDNFERGLASMSDEDKESPVGQGMEMIYKQFLAALDDIGVKAIEAVGKEFDPNFHNAVMHIDDEELGENIVVEEFQKGYIYRDSVVRHSMVKVAN